MMNSYGTTSYLQSERYIAISPTRRADNDLRIPFSPVGSAGDVLTQRLKEKCVTGSSPLSWEAKEETAFRTLKRGASAASTAEFTQSSNTFSTNKGLINNALDGIAQEASTTDAHHQEDPEQRVASQESKDEEDDQSVHSIERILCHRAASLVSTNKRRGSVWESSLMEDSMPGLVSFCNGSFAGENPMSGSSFLGDDDSVSSLECSLLNSQHSKQPASYDGTLAESPSDQNSIYGSRREFRSHVNDVLEPQARIEPNSNHQEVRWSEGSANRSSDTLPIVSRPRGESE